MIDVEASRMRLNVGSFVSLFAAALLGGFIARVGMPSRALAQDQTPVAKEIRAQSVTLVDSMGNTVGTFTTSSPTIVAIRPGSKQTKPIPVPTAIVLRDQNGLVIWHPEGDGAQFRLLNGR